MNWYKLGQSVSRAVIKTIITFAVIFIFSLIVIKMPTEYFIALSALICLAIEVRKNYKDLKDRKE